MASYYRTGKGTKRHADWYCANSRRRVRTGDPIRIPTEEVKDWAPCSVCCKGEDIAAPAPAPVRKPKPTAYRLIDKETGKSMGIVRAGTKVEAERKLRRDRKGSRVLQELAMRKGWELQVAQTA